MLHICVEDAQRGAESSPLRAHGPSQISFSPRMAAMYNGQAAYVVPTFAPALSAGHSLPGIVFQVASVDRVVRVGLRDDRIESHSAERTRPAEVDGSHP